MSNIVTTGPFVIVLPDIGDPTVCADYDEDCLYVEDHAKCYNYHLHPEYVDVTLPQLPCPFLD